MSDASSPASPPLEESDCDDNDTCENSVNEELASSSSVSPMPIASTRSTTFSQQVNAFLSHYSQFSSQTLGCDRGIKLIQYILWLLTKAPALNDETDAYSHHLSLTLTKLQKDLSTCRYILRFYGFPQALQAVLQPKLWAGEYQGKPWRDARIYRLTNVMAWSMLIYHPLEHLAWLKWNVETDREVTHSKSGKKSRLSVRLWPRSYDGGFFSVWSCRAWLIYIVAEWRCCWLKNQELTRYMQTVSSQEDKTDAPTTESQMDVEACLSRIRSSITLNRLQMVRCALFTVPCFQWSSFHPMVSENLVGSLTLAEAMTCMYQSIYAMLKA